ncbi:hypothetical protein GCM10023320_24010 [Pseudonocardia adelaidensis]|uniref:Lanthionine synthetase-like protein n=1 Tax=Pseudonocardia adelaidensis TaxID=648754 RepID=A0ABP9NGH5_9PSEU
MDGALQAAHDIGISLNNGAVWHHGRCNWIGALGTASSTSIGTRFGSMGCDVYGGTSGIAWFLGELFDATGDEVFRQGALGAIRRSLLDSSDTQPTGEGLYTGALGTAAVAARLAILLDCDELADQGLTTARSHIAPSTGFDLMSGNAGATVAYLLLYQASNDDIFLDLAVAAGERMIRGAAASRGGLSWASPSLPGRRALTGLSHGAAGAAYALIALFEASGQASFRLAAESAMEYERSWFDPQAGNWPDFREVPDTAPPTSRVPYATTWCHGAPGIYAAEVLSERSYVDEAFSCPAHDLESSRELERERAWQLFPLPWYRRQRWSIAGRPALASRLRRQLCRRGQRRRRCRPGAVRPSWSVVAVRGSWWTESELGDRLGGDRTLLPPHGG